MTHMQQPPGKTATQKSHEWDGTEWLQVHLLLQTGKEQKAIMWVNMYDSQLTLISQSLASCCLIFLTKHT